MRAAFAGIVDYAGLFPPAGCTMAQAVSAYDSYRGSPDRWMLGRFIVAASRLDELGQVVELRLRIGGAHRRHVPCEQGEPWRNSARDSLKN